MCILTQVKSWKMLTHFKIHVHALVWITIFRPSFCCSPSYDFFEVELDNPEAEKMCGEKGSIVGMKLAKPSSNAQMEDFVSYVKDNVKKDSHTGLSKADVNDYGGKFTPKNPSGDGPCIEAKRAKINGMFNDIPCKVKRAAICQEDNSTYVAIAIVVVVGLLVVGCGVFMYRRHQQERQRQAELHAFEMQQIQIEAEAQAMEAEAVVMETEAEIGALRGQVQQMQARNSRSSGRRSSSRHSSGRHSSGRHRHRHGHRRH